MVSLVSDDFEANNLDKWNYKTNWACDSANPNSGTYCAKFNNAAPNSLGISSVSKEGGKYTFDFYYRTTSTTGSSPYILNIGFNSGMNWICVLARANAALRYFDDSGSLQPLPTATSISANTWYHFVIVLDFADNSISWEVDGNSKGSINFTKDSWGETLDPDPPTSNEIYISPVGSASISTFIDDVSITWESGVAGGSLVLLGRRTQKAILVR